MLHPALLLHMIQINITTRKRIPMRRRQDTPPPQLQCLVRIQIIPILGIQHTIGKRLPTAHAEQVPSQPRAIAIDIVQCGPLLRRDAGAHGAHAEPVAFVAVDEVREDLGGGGDGDAALVSELV